MFFFVRSAIVSWGKIPFRTRLLAQGNKKSRPPRRLFLFVKYRNLSQVGFQQFAACAVAQAADCLFLDLAYTLTRQAELFADLLEGHFRATDTEEVLDDVALTVGQRR